MITAALVGYLLWLFFKGTHTAGTLVGYGKKSPNDSVYYPVLEFVDRTGMTHRAYADEGSSLYDVNKIGQRVSLSYHQGETTQAHVNGSIGIYIVLAVLLALSIGGYLLIDSNFHLHASNFVVAGALVIYSFLRMGLIQGIIKAIEHPGWRLKPVSAMDPPVTLTPVEELKLAQLTIKQAQTAQMRKIPYPIIAVIGIVLIALCCYTATKQWYLESVGTRAPGRIVDYRRGSSGGSHSSTVYYPVVEFSLPNQARIRFKDRVGSSMTHSKREVTVLYDPSRPQSAIIDYGIWNWIAPAALLLFGLLLLWIAERARVARMQSRSAAEMDRVKIL